MVLNKVHAKTLELLLTLELFIINLSCPVDPARDVKFFHVFLAKCLVCKGFRLCSTGCVNDLLNSKAFAQILGHFYLYWEEALTKKYSPYN